MVWTNVSFHHSSLVAYALIQSWDLEREPINSIYACPRGKLQKEPDHFIMDQKLKFMVTATVLHFFSIAKILGFFLHSFLRHFPEGKNPRGYMEYTYLFLIFIWPQLIHRAVIKVKQISCSNGHQNSGFSNSANKNSLITIRVVT